jgi:hypothetical protein
MMLAAEVRYRAAGDGSFLLPAGHSVKQNQVRSRCRALGQAGPRPGGCYQSAHATSLHAHSGSIRVFLCGGAKEDDMVVDTALWFMLAGMVALIGCGCILTAPLNSRRHGQ